VDEQRVKQALPASLWRKLKLIQNAALHAGRLAPKSKTIFHLGKHTEVLIKMRLLPAVLLGLLLTAGTAPGQTYTISTIAGSGTAGFSGDNGPATSAQLRYPFGVAVDAAVNIYIADYNNNCVRKVSNGVITTVAGNGTQGSSGDGFSAVSAELVSPTGVAIDSAGNLYIAGFDGSIRKVSNGVITTVVGSENGLSPTLGDNGPATLAELSEPQGIAVDSTGNLYIADTGDNRIRKVSKGVITTVAGGGAEVGDNISALAASLNQPTGIAVDSAGNLYIADRNNYRIRKVSNGIITTVAGSGTAGFSGDNGPATSAKLNLPSGIAVDSTGNLYIADVSNYRIRKVSNGVITTIAGNGKALFSGDYGPATSAQLTPLSLALDSVGEIYVSDYFNNRIRLLTPAPAVPAPSITPAGIVPIYSTASTIQPGEWISIYGANLATSTALYSGSLPYPTTLGGTTVTIDGKTALLYYASPTLIDLIAPADTATGTATVTVTTVNGTANATVTLSQFGPSFFLLDSKHVAGIILRTNGSGSQGGGTYDFLGPTGSSVGYATVAAKAGDIVELFADGLGPTNPAVPAGQGSVGPAPTTNPVTLFINNASVTPSYAGASSEVGIYQINVTIPAGLGTGDVPLVATLGGVQTPSTVVISLQ
jgi:uncharacterized protein (TIGR03437 family)